MWIASTDLDLHCDGCGRDELIQAGNLRDCWRDARGWKRRGAFAYCPACKAQRGYSGGWLVWALEWLWETVHRVGWCPTA